mmetsp:Transcript_40705/g.85516  ORF Transcript_40705/g.85516 Transcript_40705/m.85516 type:complete len:164 (-) Transcript_40705:394-885(-)|eukprot:CAMPEP_0183737678 /NCGR_PEP_ID=MMETSP0737-20130205/52604_1 /TAXON_ID=385413 /ORGANISM="Thalassiosira miniscula, Strain CCMP1093" /LENGTH=163 /DNA_ID=CAMNT_0025972013 /DNA_START=83 /DNA_END=574 /DNA_ORIENTATION=-
MASQLEELVGPTLVNNKGEEVKSSEALQGKKYVMLYFSAHWCPPCRKFTPLLAEAYNAHKSYIAQNYDIDAEAIEVIFISLDSVQSEYDSYRNSMPWLSVPFANLHKLRIKDTLSSKYGVRGIPDLIVLDGTSGEVVARNGRGEYVNYFKGEYNTASGGCIVS